MKYEYKMQKTVFTAENIDILEVSRDKNFKLIHRNGRQKHGFMYTVSGAMFYTFSQDGEKSIYVTPGELLFIPKGSVYTGTYFQERTEVKIVQFDISTGELPAYLSSPQKIGLPNAAEQINAFFKPLKNHMTNNPFYYLSCLYGLWWQIDDFYSKSPSKYRKLQAALSEISEYYNRNEKVSYYAELCNMSEVGFRRLFREYTGRSPIEYRNDIRLNNAKIKLQSGEYNVSEAAETSGFSSLSFFIQLYKKKFGNTPKKE